MPYGSAHRLTRPPHLDPPPTEGANVGTPPSSQSVAPPQGVQYPSLSHGDSTQVGKDAFRAFPGGVPSSQPNGPLPTVNGSWMAHPTHANGPYQKPPPQLHVPNQQQVPSSMACPPGKKAPPQTSAGTLLTPGIGVPSRVSQGYHQGGSSPLVTPTTSGDSHFAQLIDNFLHGSNLLCC